MDEKQKQGIFEKYFDDKMTAEEKADFDLKIKNEPEFLEEYKLENAARKIVHEAGREELFQNMETFENEWKAAQKKPKIVPFFNRKIWAMAALFLAILSVAIWMMGDGQKNSEQIFATYFETYRPPVNERDISRQKENNFQKASEYYMSENYAPAAEHFEKAMTDGNSIGYICQYYRGISLLALDPPDAESAISSFDFVLGKDTDFREQSLWYKSMALLYLNWNAEAENILREIIEGDLYQAEKAREILNEIE